MQLPRLRLLLWLALACFVGPASSRAVDGTWVLDGSANWSNTTAWSGGAAGIANGAGSTAFFTTNITTTRTITLNSARTIGELVFSDGGVNSNEWILTGPNVLTLNNSGSSPTINAQTDVTIDVVLAGSSGLTKTGARVVRLTQDATYSGGTSINGATMHIGVGGTTGALGSGDVQILGSNLVVNRSNTYIFSQNISGSGRLVQRGTGTTYLTGNNDGYSGTVEVEFGKLYVGNGGAVGTLGSGNISISSGASLYINHNDTVVISSAVTGDGNLFQVGTGTTILTGTSSYFSTEVSAGTLQISGGGQVSNGLGYVGNAGVGNAVVSGINSQWTLTSILYVGYDGTGTLRVSDGGQVQSEYGFLGHVSTGNGTATISGTGSQWSMTIYLSVGRSGTGTLNVQNGGTVSSETGYLGQFSTARGTAVITGTGSRWSMTNDLYVGSNGAGTLNVQNGGTVTSGNGFLGFFPLGSGTASITGSGSQWTITNDLYLGGNTTASGGSSRLSVTGGGMLNVGTTLKLWNNGTLTIDGGSVTARNVNRSTGTLQFLDGTLTVSGGVYTQTTGSGTAGNILILNGNTAGADPLFQMTNGATAVGVEATVVGLTNRGELLISGGSMLTNTGSTILLTTGIGRGHGYVGFAAASTGTATVVGANSEWNLASTLLVGYFGTGVLNVQNGGAVGSPNGYLGFNSTGTGTATIDGSGSQWTLTNELFVGLSGTGALVVSGGGQVTSGFGYVGSAAGSTGTATVVGATSEWNLASGLVVGHHGTGVLNVQNGGAVGSLFGYVGNQTTGNGTATINGSGSQWTLTNYLYVSYSGTGALNVQNGGAVRSDLGYLGYQSNGKGTATISGANSQWTLTNDLYVGYSGTGVLNLQNGGAVRSGLGYLGYQSTGKGTATIDGNGSQWTPRNDLYVGYSGTGTLVVSGGGLVTSGTGYLGAFSGATGTAAITGAGSQWTITNGLYVGGNTTASGGSGRLSVTGGGALNVGTTLKLWNNGTLTIDGGSVTARNLDRSLGTLVFNDGTLTVSGGVYTHTSGSGTANNIFTLNGNSPSVVPTFELTNGATAVGVEATVIGSTGQGQLLISGGSTLTNTGSSITLGTVGGNAINRGHGYVGLAAGATGTATVSGANSQWTLAKHLFVGYSGNGTLNVADGGRVGSYDGYLGVFSSVGTATVSGPNSQWTLTNNLYAGYSGTGTLNIADGGRIESMGGRLGFVSDGMGTATVSGANSQWTMTSDLRVGDSGTGVLNVAAGSRVVSNNVYFGFSSSGVGTATVSGANSQWTLTGELHVGESGTGTLNVADGGRIVNNYGWLGSIEGAAGTVIVSGANSQWTLTTDLYVGESGTGTLNIANGGRVDGNSAYLGHSSSGVGTATVSGNGSQWTVTNSLYIGGDESSLGGTGTITVSDGGTLQVGGLTQIWQTGSVHIGSGGTFHTGTLTVMEGGQFTVDAGGTFTGAVQNTGNYVLNGVLTGDAVVNVGGEFGGSGVVVGKLSGEGLVTPGNSPGILDAVQIDPTSGLDFLFEFTLANAVPDYLSRTMPGNDILHLTDNANPFLSALTFANKITIDFQIASLNDGDIFLGGFFTNVPGFDFAGTIGDAEFEFLFNGSALDANQWHVGVSTIPQLGADFGAGYGGSVNGRVMQVQVQAVPEPGSMILCGIAAGGFYLRRRRNKRTTDGEPLAKGD